MAANNDNGLGWLVGFLVVMAVALALKWVSPPKPTTEEMGRSLLEQIQNGR